MIRLWILITLIFGSAIATAQTMYACQWLGGNGYTFKEGRWSRIAFNPGKPFFMKLTKDGLPDASTLQAVDLIPDKTRCENLAIANRPAMIACGESWGTGLTFNTITLEGARSLIFGAGTADKQRDDIAVSLFACQKM
jgi:hypothetical protein